MDRSGSGQAVVQDEGQGEDDYSNDEDVESSLESPSVRGSEVCSISDGS